MSRIGKLPISIPENVDVNYTDSKITVKGKFGTLEIEIPNVINIAQGRYKGWLYC
jgi:large subunit ribosomal protein L6